MQEKYILINKLYIYFKTKNNYINYFFHILKYIQINYFKFILKS